MTLTLFALPLACGARAGGDDPGSSTEPIAAPDPRMLSGLNGIGAEVDARVHDASEPATLLHAGAERINVGALIARRMHVKFDVGVGAEWNAAFETEGLPALLDHLYAWRAWNPTGGVLFTFAAEMVSGFSRSTDKGICNLVVCSEDYLRTWSERVAFVVSTLGPALGDKDVLELWNEPDADGQAPLAPWDLMRMTYDPMKAARDEHVLARRMIGTATFDYLRQLLSDGESLGRPVASMGGHAFTFADYAPLLTNVDVHPYQGCPLDGDAPCAGLTGEKAGYFTFGLDDSLKSNIDVLLASRLAHAVRAGVYYSEWGMDRSKIHASADAMKVNAAYVRAMFRHLKTFSYRGVHIAGAWAYQFTPDGNPHFALEGNAAGDEFDANARGLR